MIALVGQGRIPLCPSTSAICNLGQNLARCPRTTLEMVAPWLPPYTYNRTVRPKKHQGDRSTSSGHTTTGPGQAQPLETSWGKIFWRGTHRARFPCHSTLHLSSLSSRTLIRCSTCRPLLPCWTLLRAWLNNKMHNCHRKTTGTQCCCRHTSQLMHASATIFKQHGGILHIIIVLKEHFQTSTQCSVGGLGCLYLLC